MIATEASILGPSSSSPRQTIPTAASDSVPVVFYGLCSYAPSLGIIAAQPRHRVNPVITRDRAGGDGDRSGRGPNVTVISRLRAPNCSESENKCTRRHDGGGGLDGRRRDGARDKSSYEIWGEAECTKGGREGGRAAAPIVRVDIVVGGSGFGHQALLGTERGSEGGLGAGEWSQPARVHDQFHLTAARKQASGIAAAAADGAREEGGTREGGSHLARSLSPTTRWERKREGGTDGGG